MFNTPILLLIFNRPQHTQQVLDKIRAVKPAKLFIGADGPRQSNPEDISKCNETRKIALQAIDWPCEVKTLFRDTNLGCGRAPSEAISWFFENVEEGIILEDDCVPEMFFFQFCATLLAFYRNEKKIMHISGDNFQKGKKRGTGSYYFSAYNHNWGWATWRRCWSKFSYTITDFDRSKITKSFNYYGFNRKERKYWMSVFEKISATTPDDIWDYQWGYTIWKNSGLCILPNVNLVTNTGFGPQATHTTTAPKILLQVPTEIVERIDHPPYIQVHQAADHYTFNNHFFVRDTPWRYVKNKLLLFFFIRWLYKKMKTKVN